MAAAARRRDVGCSAGGAIVAPRLCRDAAGARVFARDACNARGVGDLEREIGPSAFRAGQALGGFARDADEAYSRKCPSGALVACGRPVLADSPSFARRASFGRIFAAWIVHVEPRGTAIAHGGSVEDGGLLIAARFARRLSRLFVVLVQIARDAERRQGVSGRRRSTARRTSVAPVHFRHTLCGGVGTLGAVLARGLGVLGRLCAVFPGTARLAQRVIVDLVRARRAFRAGVLPIGRDVAVGARRAAFRLVRLGLHVRPGRARQAIRGTSLCRGKSCWAAFADLLPRGILVPVEKALLAVAAARCTKDSSVFTRGARIARTVRACSEGGRVFPFGALRARVHTVLGRARAVLPRRARGAQRVTVGLVRARLTWRACGLPVRRDVAVGAYRTPF